MESGRVELHAVAAIKNQGVGRAFIKSGASPPIETAISHVSSVPFSPKISPKRLVSFRERVIAAHPSYYLTAAEASRQQEQRLLRLSAAPLQLDTDDEEVVLEAELVPLADDTPVDDESPFA